MYSFALIKKAKQFVIRAVEIVRSLRISDLNETFIGVRCYRSYTESTLNMLATVAMIFFTRHFLSHFSRLWWQAVRLLKWQVESPSGIPDQILL